MKVRTFLPGLLFIMATALNAAPPKKIGVCNPIKNAAIIASHDFSFIEDGVSSALIPSASDEEFEKKLAEIRQLPIPLYACNSFIPGSLKSVGNDAVPDSIIKYVAVALKRAGQAGVKIIVFGSGGSRRIPEGFSKDEAKKQFVALCKQIGPLAKKYKVTIVIEPLNRNETNFINSVAEGAEIVKAVNHPNIMLLADVYHMLRENEPASEIITYGKYLRHIHIAEKENRTPPGVAGDDFSEYFDAIKKSRFKGNLSIEARWTNLESELQTARKGLIF